MFYDAGNVFSSVRQITFRAAPAAPVFSAAQPNVCLINCANELNYFSHTVGFEFRYHTPIGPVSIDLAYQLNAARFLIPDGTTHALAGRRAQALATAGLSILREPGAHVLMRRCDRTAVFAAAAAVFLGGVARLRHTQVVDRIVAHVEDDIITLSEVRELAAYQQLVDGHAEPDDRLLNELIEQWVVNNEATEAQFPQPAASEVNREVQRIESSFPTSQAYAKRLMEVGLTADAVRRIVTRQIYLARYLDYKFRPAVQVDDDAIAKYYNDQLAPELKVKGQTVPPLDAVSDEIREVLTQKGINDRAATWFDETKSRLQIEIEPAPQTASNGQA